jgi:hypothetical protein
MSLQKTTSLVGKITLQNETYYIADRKGISLNTTVYENVVLSWDSAEFLSGKNGQYSSFPIRLVNGEKILQNGFIFDVTKIWNNGICEVKKWNYGDTDFNALEPYCKGIIKNFQINNNSLSFDVDLTNRKDSKLIPAIITHEQDINNTDNIDNFRKDSTTQITTENTGKFTTGDYVKLISDLRVIEYAIIKEISGDTIIFMNPLLYDFHVGGASSFPNIIEKAFIHLPKNQVDKTIPIQFGELNDVDNGKFGKLININNKVCQQVIVADYMPIKELKYIGVWETGQERFFTAKEDSGFINSGNANQPEFNRFNNFVNFTVDTTATLTETMIDFNGIGIAKVNSSDLINWVDEFDNTDTDVDKRKPLNQDILSINILAIGQELMLLVEKPVTGINEIFIDRGYLGTPVTEHLIGSKIYQSAKFSIKDLLVFTEKFMATGITNFHYSELASPYYQYTGHAGTVLTNVQDCVDYDDVTGAGSLKNMIDEDINTHAKITMNSERVIESGNALGGCRFTFDMRFKNIDKDYTVIGWYPALSYSINTTLSGTIAFDEIEELQAYEFRIYEPSADIFPDLSNDEFLESVLPIDSRYWNFVTLYPYISLGTTVTKDYFTGVINREFVNFNYGANKSANIKLDTLKKLNKKWKIALLIRMLLHSSIGFKISSESELETMGFWVDFVANFTKENIVGNILGRPLTGDIVGISGTGTANEYAVAPVHCILMILVHELGYSSVDFDDNIKTISSYENSSGNYISNEIPRLEMSYGISDKQIKGWSFVSKLASFFNYQLVKNPDGKIDIINIHEVMINTPSTSHNINIEDINFLSGKQAITVKQTGTDLIYNDVIIKYYRNNSTDKYIKNYSTPESYILKSGITLKTARNIYYDDKLRTKTIESFAIYNLYDAERLSKTILEEYAETRFFIEIIISFDHYKDNNSLTNQYKRGDLINLFGVYSGINFRVEDKFYIASFSYINNGQDILIKAKSIKPISSFEKG